MGPKTVLVVDDEAHVTHVMAFKLERAGLRVLTASDGEEALEIAERETPDVVVTDLQMPYIGGFELARRLRALDVTSDTPVLMVTARGHVLDESEMSQTNIRKVISKPFAPRHLLEAVLGLLGDPETSAGVAAA